MTYTRKLLNASIALAIFITLPMSFGDLFWFFSWIPAMLVFTYLDDTFIKN